jgi:hypothetical protein
MDIKSKRDFKNDNRAVVPLLIWVIVAIGGIVVAGVGVYQVTSPGTTIYNITDTGFSIAGADVSWLWMIAIIAGFLIFLIWLGRRKPQQQQPITIRERG